MQTPTTGRIVHVKRADGALLPNSATVAPAMVVSAHGGLSVNLRVFYDDSATPAWETSVMHESELDEPFPGLVWFWPPRAS